MTAPSVALRLSSQGPSAAYRGLSNRIILLFDGIYVVRWYEVDSLFTSYWWYQGF